jgi:hypothetical protein
VVENINTVEGYAIQRNLLIGFIKSLGDSTNESFITPAMAMKTIDLVDLLNHRTGVPEDVCNKNNRFFYFHSWIFIL